MWFLNVKTNTFGVLVSFNKLEIEEPSFFSLFTINSSRYLYIDNLCLMTDRANTWGDPENSVRGGRVLTTIFSSFFSHQSISHRVV